MPKQIASATVEGIRKRGTSRKGWRDEVEEDLNIMGIKNRQAMARDRGNGVILCWKAKSTASCGF
jgi:hypothetical protein